MSPTATPISVLIVDDNVVMRGLLRQILTDKGMNLVGEAADGPQALDMVSRLKPDVVCLDIEMPEMNGLDVLARIQSQYEDVAVVMVTGDSQASSVQQAIKTGARGYIVKPFNGTKVVETVRKAAGR
ncbi:response regulator transcription factor [Marinospirillum perlucidum]|uniref:response regulator transcription factor n=1 Tax=Marinospirillum perlucidum TaxID=1982602 RepID=UPI000DF1BF00|nr:response regulator [Marinospirillum perlucidum]